MKPTPIVLASLALAGLTSQDIVTFDAADVGKPPTGWTAGQTGTGQAMWAVVPDPTAPSKPNVLTPAGAAADPWCIKYAPSLKDGFVEVKFKAVSGKEDQAGGVLWRAKDVNNYYVARANALEDNVTIYHTINGRRTEKKRASMKVAANQWHTLRVEFQANHFTVTLDGRRALEWDDNPSKDAGKVGVLDRVVIPLEGPPAIQGHREMICLEFDAERVPLIRGDLHRGAFLLSAAAVDGVVNRDVVFQRVGPCHVVVVHVLGAPQHTARLVLFA